MVAYRDISEVSVVQVGNCDLISGDCLDVLRVVPDNSIDAICCDPPAGIEFMGKEWDSFKNCPVHLSSEEQAKGDMHPRTPFVHKSSSRSIGEHHDLNRTWEFPFSEHGYTDGADRIPAPSFSSSRNPVCRKCHKHKRGWKDVPGCRCEIPGFDESVFRATVRDAFVTWLSTIAKELLRVIKPGGYAFVWALPKTSHWTAWAFEDAGWECRDIVHHIFGTGYPKSLNVGCAIDKAAKGHSQGASDPDSPNSEVTDWAGWGTALKPAVEHWHLFRKQLSKSKVAANVLRWGTGALNIDGCRVTTNETITNHARTAEAAKSKGIYGNSCAQETHQTEGQKLGRWPSNLGLSHDPHCVKLGTTKVKACGVEASKQKSAGYAEPSLGKDSRQVGDPCINHGDENGKETIDLWACVPSCPCRLLDAQSGFSKTKYIETPSDCGGNTWGGTFQTKRGARGHTDQGGASRFFNTFHEELCVPFIYQKKPSPTERHGVVKNKHPTTKAVDLCRYLTRLITPLNGVVLDCFMGSGSTGLACIREGFSFIGIEKEPEYFEIAKARIAAEASL